MASTLATIGILSIGDMGLGIAKLLIAHNYRVVTNITGRSEDTQERAREGQVEALSGDEELVLACDYILSIVPPRDAIPTAQRVIEALKSSPHRKVPLYFLDLNAISPRSARKIAALFSESIFNRFIDGGIIGGPPRFQPSTEPITSVPAPQSPSPTSWTRPSIMVSGPHPLDTAPISGAHLATTLNLTHISPLIGPASGLKCCFATTTKGLTALCIQAFTTADSLGVLPHLRQQMLTFNPNTLKAAERGVTGMPPKAYRWDSEMEEIAATHAEEGGFTAEKGLNVFTGVAAVYRAVAEDTELGKEKIGKRKRGKTVEDVAAVMAEGLQGKRKRGV